MLVGGRYSLITWDLSFITLFVIVFNYVDLMLYSFS